MFDPSPDLTQVADGVEPVRLLRRGQSPGSPGTLVAAHRGNVTAREAAASGGRLTGSDVVWRVPGAVDPPPRIGDLVVDAAGQRWTILAIRQLPLGAGWRLSARNLALVAGLDSTIAILRPEYTKSSGGAAEAVWRTWRTGVRARVQPDAATTVTEANVQRSVARAVVLIVDDLPIDAAHRIQTADGAVYRVCTVRPAAQLGEPTTIEVEAVP